jgi:hypothetical protein
VTMKTGTGLLFLQVKVPVIENHKKLAVIEQTFPQNLLKEPALLIP